MRKSRILGCALTLAATLVVGGAMGQIEDSGNFKLHGTTNEEISLVTRGGKLHLFVQPDLAYSYQYNATDGWKVATGHTWKFTPLGSFSFNSPDTQRPNYVEISVDNNETLGEHELEVTETLPTGFGCDPTSTKFKIYVLDKPTVSFDPNQGVALGSGKCGTISAGKFTLTASATDNVKLKFTLKKYSVAFDPSTNAKTETEIGTGTSVDFTPATKDVILKGSATAFNPASPSGLTTYTISYDYPEMKLNGTDRVTLYKYSFETGDGINDFVSRKSFGTYDPSTKKFDASTIFHPATGSNVIAFYVSAPPKTGPVYHISNNIAK